MADESNAGANGSQPGGEQADPATVFAALAEIIYQGSDANEMYAAICIAATMIVRGCDHASLLVRDNDRYVTVGASDRLAQKIGEWKPFRPGPLVATFFPSTSSRRSAAGASAR